MPFDKKFFDQIGDHLDEYFRIYPCGVATLTIRTRVGSYNVLRFLKKEDNLVTFAYHPHPKSKERVPIVQEKSGEKRAWPAVTIPYEEIILVELNPGSDSAIGFRCSDLEGDR